MKSRRHRAIDKSNKVIINNIGILDKKNNKSRKKWCKHLLRLIYKKKKIDSL